MSKVHEKVQIEITLDVYIGSQPDNRKKIVNAKLRN